jgi:hypothetical protein
MMHGQTQIKFILLALKDGRSALNGIVMLGLSDPSK